VRDARVEGIFSSGHFGVHIRVHIRTCCERSSRGSDPLSQIERGSSVLGFGGF